MYFLFPQKSNEKISVLPISLSLQIYLLKAIHWLPARLVLLFYNTGSIAYCVFWPDSCKRYQFLLLHSKPVEGVEKEIILSSLTALRLRYKKSFLTRKNGDTILKSFSLQNIWCHFSTGCDIISMNHELFSKWI